MFFWNSFDFFMTQRMLAIWSLAPVPFLNPAWISRISQFSSVLLKPGLENFDHYFTSMWDECNCAVVWAFFGIAFLWDWNENRPFPGHLYFMQLPGHLLMRSGLDCPSAAVRLPCHCVGCGGEEARWTVAIDFVVCPGFCCPQFLQRS